MKQDELNLLRKLRHLAWLRQGCLCYWCQKPIARNEITADHLTERRHGGETVASNIVAACTDCNNGRSNPGVRATLISACGIEGESAA